MLRSLVQMRDEQGKLMNDFTGRVRADEQGPPAGSLRTVTVALDTAQYQLDANASVATVRSQGGAGVTCSHPALQLREEVGADMIRLSPN